MTCSDRQVDLYIYDDGIGIETKPHNQNDGFGLQGMHDRAAAVGAQLDVTSRPGSGTTIRFSWELFHAD